MSVASKPTLDEEAALALTAMRRARVRAVKIARATGTSIVESKDGKLVLIEPNSAELEPGNATEPVSGVADRGFPDMTAFRKNLGVPPSEGNTALEMREEDRD